MCSLGYAYVNPNDNDNDNVLQIEKKKSSKSKTLKRNSKTDVQKMMNEIHNTEDSSNNMANFNPPPKPKSAGMERKGPESESESEADIDQDTVLDQDTALDGDNFKNISSVQAEDYYRANAPYYTQMSQAPISNKDELMKKMEKILYLLEEQRDEKTGHVTEELILYSFLGVFIIFVVDSFARAGKYVR